MGEGGRGYWRPRRMKNEHEFRCHGWGAGILVKGFIRPKSLGRVQVRRTFCCRKTEQMGSRVIYKPVETQEKSRILPVPQPFLYPEGRFEGRSGDAAAFWVCVRTRPRWEKKFAEWLLERRRNHFLPVFRHQTASGRKRRTSQLPLFPGFVFAEGDLAKKDFAQTGCVAYVLRPRSAKEAAQLHRELRDIWRGLTSGLYVSPVQSLAAGETCVIMSGPLQGVEAKFERMGREGRLILQVEIMGGGVAVEVPSHEVEVKS